MSRPADSSTPFILASIILVVLPFDIGVPTNGFTPLVIRPLMIVIVGCSITGIAIGRDRVRWDVAIALTVALCGWIVASLASDDRAFSFAVTARIFVVFAVALFFSTLDPTNTSRSLMWSALATMAVVAGSIGLVVLTTGEDIGPMSQLLGKISRTGGVTRLTRPFPHANIASMVFAPTAVALWARLARGHRGALVAVGAIVATISTVFTLSRGGLIVLGVGLLLVAAVHAPTDRRSLLIALPAAVVLLSPIWLSRWDGRLGEPVTPRPPTRPEIWGQAWRAWTQNPVLGVGPGQLPSFWTQNPLDGVVAVIHSHNTILEVLATSGLVGFLTMLPLAALLLVALGSRDLSASVRLPCLVACAHMVVDHPLVFTGSGSLFAVFAGLTLARRS